MFSDAWNSFKGMFTTGDYLLIFYHVVFFSTITAYLYWIAALPIIKYYKKRKIARRKNPLNKKRQEVEEKRHA